MDAKDKHATRGKDVANRYAMPGLPLWVMKCPGDETYLAQRLFVRRKNIPKLFAGERSVPDTSGK